LDKERGSDFLWTRRKDQKGIDVSYPKLP